MIKMFGKQVNHEFGINRKGFLNNLPTPPPKKISSGIDLSHYFGNWNKSFEEGPKEHSAVCGGVNASVFSLPGFRVLLVVMLYIITTASSFIISSHLF